LRNYNASSLLVSVLLLTYFLFSITFLSAHTTFTYIYTLSLHDALPISYSVFCNRLCYLYFPVTFQRAGQGIVCLDIIDLILVIPICARSNFYKKVPSREFFELFFVDKVFSARNNRIPYGFHIF